MNAQYSGSSYVRQPAAGTERVGHGETEEEMQHMLQFLDASIITPPSANDSAAASQLPQQLPRPQQQHSQQQPTTEQLRDMPALHETEGGNVYNELGEVIDLLGSLDANDTDPALVQQHQDGSFASALQQQHQRYSETTSMNSIGFGGAGLGHPEVRQSGPSISTMGSESATQTVRLSRSTSADLNHSGTDNISPVGLLGGPSMSPATINWLQSLVPSTSTESLTGLISPATLYTTGGGSASGVSAVGGVAGIAGIAGGCALTESTAAKSGGIPRTPSCEIIDWKAYNDGYGSSEKAHKEPAKWRVIPQHGPHADPTANNSVTVGKIPPGAVTMEANNLEGVSATIPGATGNQIAAAVAEAEEDGGLRTHLTRQFQTIKNTVVSLVGALSAPASPSSEENYTLQEHQQSFDAAPTVSTGELTTNNSSAPGLSVQEQIHLAAKKMAEEKNKRKALVSPEYVQYGNPESTIVGAVSKNQASGIKSESVQYATKIPEPTGRRPFKKSLHQMTAPTELQQQLLQQDAPPTSGDGKDESIRCKCTGKCRNARCACVKAGLVCGVHCKCVSCANPFVPMAREGIDIQLMVHDVCLMQYLSKVKDMQELLDSTVSYECCEGGGGVVQVKHTVEHGFACPHCGAHFTYSWCNNRLCPDSKKPRRHCEKCRRCGDHRNKHCDLCNHCYFAGVANSFRCSCQSASSGGSGVKSRAVVPNPVRRDAEYAKELASGDRQNGPPQLFGTGNPAFESGAGRDENATANDSPTREGDDGADDSCKMQ